MSDPVKPEEPRDAPVPSHPPPPARGGGGFFTSLVALAALAVALYLLYKLEGHKMMGGPAEPAAERLVEAIAETGGEADQLIIDNLVSLEERIVRLEDATSQVEDIIEQLGQEIGRTQGISDGASSIPLYQLRVSLADVRLRMTGDPAQVLGELNTLLPFVPENERNLRAALESDIARLGALPSKDELLAQIDGLSDALQSPLLAEGPEIGGERQGFAGAFLDLVKARRSVPPEQQFLARAREAAGEARTLALVGDRENYVGRLREISENVEKFRERYGPEALGLVESSLAGLSELGLPEYSLSAAQAI